jgi:hypothetical protein
MCEVKTDALCVCESLRGTCAVGGALAGQVCAVLCWAMLLKFLVGVQAGLTKHCWKLWMCVCVCVCVCVCARARVHAWCAGVSCHHGRVWFIWRATVRVRERPAGS